MMKLIIIRHPETNYIAGLTGEPQAPSPKGLIQLAAISKLCRTERAEAVVHSSLPRATVSADFLAETLDIPSIEQQGLEERDFGKWSVREWPEISVEINKLDLNARYTFRPPDGETWQEMDVRVSNALHAISLLDYETVAVMTHAGTIRVLLTLLQVRTRAQVIKFIPALGKCLVEDFDPNTLPR